MIFGLGEHCNMINPADTHAFDSFNHNMVNYFSGVESQPVPDMVDLPSLQCELISLGSSPEVTDHRIIEMLRQTINRMSQQKFDWRQP